VERIKNYPDLDAGRENIHEPHPPEGNYPALTNPDEVGRAVSLVGSVDQSAGEFALSPDGFGLYPSRFPEGVDFTAGRDDPSTGWSYIQPGPQDAWAGSRPYTFTYRFDLGEVPADGLRFIAWLVDTPNAFPSSVKVSLNGGPEDSTALPPGGGDGYHRGDGAPNLDRGIRPTSISFDLPASMLKTGKNILEITRAEGSWLVYDAFGVFEQRHPRDCRRFVLTGHIEPEQVSTYVYAPVDVPAGTTEVHVRQDYSNRGPNHLDLGVFGPGGIEPGNSAGFRGCSGGARSDFTISASYATPGYMPGPIEPGTWNVALGPYRVAPGGMDWKLEVTLRSDPPQPPFRAQPAPGKVNDRPGWYCGDLHVHTMHSDGRYLPEEIVTNALQSGLDFVISTDHNTPSANLSWGRYAGSDLLIISGEEVTTRHGHMGAVGLSPGHWIDFRYWPRDGLLPRFVQEIHDDGGLAIANHPFARCDGCDWRFPYADVDAIEVWNGPWDDQDEQALRLWDGMLRRGDFRPATGGSDAHRPPDVVGLPRTVVRAESLSENGILAGIRAGRVYLAGTADTSLSLTATAGELHAGIGEHLDGDPNQAVRVSLKVKGAPDTTATLRTNNGTVESVPITSECQEVAFSTLPRETRYVRAEVRDSQGAMVALTNPVFLGRGSDATVPRS
jgi:hypothetical protein